VGGFVWQYCLTSLSLPLTGWGYTGLPVLNFEVWMQMSASNTADHPKRRTSVIEVKYPSAGNTGTRDCRERYSGVFGNILVDSIQ